MAMGNRSENHPTEGVGAAMAGTFIHCLRVTLEGPLSIELVAIVLGKALM